MPRDTTSCTVSPVRSDVANAGTRSSNPLRAGDRIVASPGIANTRLVSRSHGPGRGAGSDSGAYAYANGAIDQAHRAVQELLPQARLPRWHAQPGPDPRALGL